MHCCKSRTLNLAPDVERNSVNRQSGGIQREQDMSKRDHKASEQDWRSNPSHNTRRDYPAHKKRNWGIALWLVALAAAMLALRHCA